MFLFVPVSLVYSPERTPRKRLSFPLLRSSKTGVLLLSKISINSVEAVTALQDNAILVATKVVVGTSVNVAADDAFIAQ